VLVAETALIQRSMWFPKVTDDIRRNRQVNIVVTREGQERPDGLMLTMGVPEVSDRDYCLSRLRELEQCVLEGFHESRDLRILTKLYGEDWRRNIMQYEIKQGLVKSETMYKRSVHELSPAWDFFVVIVYRDLDAQVEVQKERAKVMKAVFPNTADFEQGDKRRWELITEHWDEKLVEVPLD